MVATRAVVAAAVALGGLRGVPAALPARAQAVAAAPVVCPPAGGPQGLSAGGVQATWRVAALGGGESTEHGAGSETLPVGRPFGLVVSACPADVDLVAVDADMPVHRHGMNYRPSVQPDGPGRWRVDGLLLHMPGDWRLRLDWRRADGGRVTLVQPVRAE